MTKADVIIVGGGLAGLTAAIHLSSLNYKILLFEKEKFPQHKVCGEYLSKEVLPYLKSLNINLEHLSPPIIDQLQYSTQKGRLVEIPLPLGGIGISRFTLDNFLFQKAVENGVEVVQENVSAVHDYEDFFEVRDVKKQSYYSKVVLGAFGKRSNLDKYLDRDFINKKSSWLAVKAHYKHDYFPENLVGLHNFKGGYCGLSKTEEGDVNVCYLASYKSFKKYKNPIIFSENVLHQNKHLKKFFSEAEMLFDKPISIAQISFDQKETVKDHVLMLGDAAGLIHPLCGNGMAMAIHSAKIASEAVDEFLSSKEMNFSKLEKDYTLKWTSAFRKRLKYGKWLQNIMLKESIAEASTGLIAAAPFILPQIIKRTHGKPIQ